MTLHRDFFDTTRDLNSWSKHEKLLGQPKHTTMPSGKLGQVFEEAARLPCRQQEKKISETLVD